MIFIVPKLLAAVAIAPPGAMLAHVLLDAGAEKKLAPANWTAKWSQSDEGIIIFFRHQFDLSPAVLFSPIALVDAARIHERYAGVFAPTSVCRLRFFTDVPRMVPVHLFVVGSGILHHMQPTACQNHVPKKVRHTRLGV